MKGSNRVAVAVLAFFTCSSASSVLEAQCPPPAGTYNMSVSPSGPIEACPGSTVSINIVGSSTGGLIRGFGFNLTITGGPVANVTVVAGFPTGGTGGTFMSAQSAAGDQIAALGVEAASGPGLTTLAIITFDPTTTNPLTLAFGGTLPLAGGVVPIDHLVVGGCDVWSGTTPALTVTGGSVVCPNFIRGDCNNNGLVIGFVGDIVFLLDYLFGGGPTPACENACDANDDDILGVADTVYLANWLFLAGPPPPPPTPMYVVGGGFPFLGDCGPDPTGGALTCASHICP